MTILRKETQPEQSAKPQITVDGQCVCVCVRALSSAASKTPKVEGVHRGALSEYPKGNFRSWHANCCFRSDSWESGHAALWVVCADAATWYGPVGS